MSEELKPVKYAAMITPDDQLWGIIEVNPKTGQSLFTGFVAERMTKSDAEMVVERLNARGRARSDLARKVLNEALESRSVGEVKDRLRDLFAREGIAIKDGEDEQA